MGGDLRHPAPAQLSPTPSTTCCPRPQLGPVHTHLCPQPHPRTQLRLLPPACILSSVDPSVAVTLWLPGKEQGGPVLSLSSQWERSVFPPKPQARAMG